MQRKNIENLQHSHSFGHDAKRPGEVRTFIVIAITASMMILEIATGIAFGSMALLADGLHMGSHAVALAINAFAYIYARRHAKDQRFSFGTGKVNTLGGYTGAVLLAVFAAMMVFESISRLLNPVDIAFNQAILVATLGLLVNGASVFILDVEHSHEDHSHAHHDHAHHHDHNLKSAYLHVLADALTSLLAIFALLIGKYFGAIWMDPLMGIVGAVLVTKWSLGLLKSTSSILLDQQETDEECRKVREVIESDGKHTVVDLHLWNLGSGISSGIISIVSSDPQTTNYYKEKINEVAELQHITVELHSDNGDDH